MARMVTQIKIPLLYLCLCLFATYASAQVPADQTDRMIESYLANNHDNTGVYVLEIGEESLLGRAWLTDYAKQTIDIQYFIWSNDNIGILASEKLLTAAERGISIRILVDDLLVDVEDATLLALANHPNIEIKIYNPLHSVGVSFWQKLLNLVTNFRQSNQRMHNKVAIFDSKMAITGGRNMADEYFDFDHEYNFRDRDILVVGNVVSEMDSMFEDYWQSPLSFAVEALLEKDTDNLDLERINATYAELHDYANNPLNFFPEVRRSIIDMSTQISDILDQLTITDIDFIYDKPGKNEGTEGLKGGGDATTVLLNEILNAKSSIIIQSPYLVLSNDVLNLFKKLISNGVEIQINTNSLSSTDNLMAYSGYDKKKQALIAAGIKIFEFKPDPQIRDEILLRRPKNGNIPIFAIHAKTMVIDNAVVYIGTFNLDPRSINLNTEVGVIVRNSSIAMQVAENIERDMASQNSWSLSELDANEMASYSKRIKLFLYNLLPLEPVL